jgi:hypothetical protein
VRDHDVHEWVGKTGEAELAGAGDAGEPAAGLREHGDPALLPLGQRAVLQDDDTTAARRPPSGRHLTAHGVTVITALTQLGSLWPEPARIARACANCARSRPSSRLWTAVLHVSW